MAQQPDQPPATNPAPAGSGLAGLNPANLPGPISTQPQPNMSGFSPANLPGPINLTLPTRRGQDRLNYLLAFWQGDPNSPEYARYVLNLPEDPNDPEYTLALRQLKAKVTAMSALHPTDPLGVQQGSLLNQGGRVGYSKAPTPPKATAPFSPAPTPPKAPNIPGPGESTSRNEQVHPRLKPKFLILRQGVSATGYVNLQSDASPYVTQFAQSQLLQMDGGKPGGEVPSDFIYMGRTTDAKTGQMTDSYYYKDDATASIMTWAPTKVKKYQAMMGLPQTGTPDAKLINEWQQAIGYAQMAAEMGLHVDAETMLQQTIQNDKAQGSLGGGGGGGAQPLTIDDYYRGMQAVLGDISGVNRGVGV